MIAEAVLDTGVAVGTRLRAEETRLSLSLSLLTDCNLDLR